MSLLETLIDAAIDAGAVIMDVYSRPIAAEQKADGSPVTEADGRAEALILERLAPTGIPVLAEESATQSPVTPDTPTFFCVDPLDGTKEFVKRNGEFTVNIALIEAGRAVMGVVYAPALGSLFAGSVDGAFWGEVANGRLGARRPLAVDDAGPLRIVASRSHGHAALATFCEAMAVTEDVSVGSSLKFCLLARGAARLYPRLTPTSEWDTAAGQAVLEAAGGSVVDLSGAPLRYGKGGRHLNPYFVAASGPALAHRAAMLMAKVLSPESAG